MNVGRISAKETITASPSTLLAEVARLMLEGIAGAVVITQSPLDRPVVVGIAQVSDELTNLATRVSCRAL